MTAKQKAGLVVMLWILKLIAPFKHNFEFDKFKDDLWAAIDGEGEC